MKKDVQIKYAENWTYAGKVRLPVFKHEVVGRHFVKHYISAIYALAGLNAACRDLMDYIVYMRMDDQNEFSSNRKFREDFMKFVQVVTGGEVSYVDSTIRNSLAVLKKKKLIIQKFRGVFIVNPEFFFKNSDTERLEAIRLTLEFNNTNHEGQANH